MTEINLTWMIIGVFVMGFMGIVCYGLAVLNQDMEDKRDHGSQKPTEKTNDS